MVVEERFRSSRGWLDPDREYLLPEAEARKAVREGQATWGEEPPVDDDPLPGGLSVDPGG